MHYIVNNIQLMTFVCRKFLVNNQKRFSQGRKDSILNITLTSTQPAASICTGVLFQGVKKPEREINHSCPCGAEIKNEWNYTSVPLYASMA
jgi:hypothetical protein